MNEYMPPAFRRSETQKLPVMTFFDPKDGVTKGIDSEGYVVIAGIATEQHAIEHTASTQAQTDAGPLIKFKLEISGRGTAEQIAGLQLTNLAQQKPMMLPPAPMLAHDSQRLGYASLLPEYNPETTATVHPPSFNENSPDNKNRIRLHLLRGKISKLAVVSTLVLSSAVFSGLAAHTLSEAKANVAACASPIPVFGPGMQDSCVAGKFVTGMFDYVGLYHQITGTK